MFKKKKKKDKEYDKWLSEYINLQNQYNDKLNQLAIVKKELNSYNQIYDNLCKQYNKDLNKSINKIEKILRSNNDKFEK